MSAALVLSAPEQWLTQEQVLLLTSWSDAWLRNQVRAGVVIARELEERGRNGKPVRRYLAASLPLEAQARLSRPMSKAVETPAPAPSPLVLQPSLKLDAAPVRVKLPNAGDQAEAERCLRAILPLVEWKSDRERYAALRLGDGTPVTSLELLAQFQAESSAAILGESVSKATLWRWKAAYEKHGLAGLAPKRRSDKGRSRWAAANRTLADVAAHIYLGDKTQPGQSVTVAWEQVCRMAAERELEAPSYETVRSFLENPDEVSTSMKALQLKGKKGYEAAFAPYLKRGYTEPAGAIWMSDHMICDTLVQDDCFDRDLRHCRIQMTTIMDYRARFVVGVSWSRNGSSHSIKRALLASILKYGLPEQFYCDNGKDYRKIAEGASREDLYAAETATGEMRVLDASVMKRLGIAVTFCKPFHPQSKHVEKYHRFFHERFDRAFPTYTAGATHLRPDATSEALVAHKKLVSIGDTRASKLPLASEYIRMAEAWIRDVYHQRPMSAKAEGMNGRSPAQCFLEEFNPAQRTPPPLEELAGLLAETRLCKVSNCAVTIDGVRFVPAYGDEVAPYVMHERGGREEKVIVAYDPLDMSQAAVLDADGYPLCHLERQQLTRFAQDDETSAQISGMEQQRGMLGKATRQSVAALGQRVRAAGYVSQADQLRAMAGLQATGTDSHNPVSNLVPRPQQTGGRTTIAAPMYVGEAVEAFFSESSK